MEYLVIETNKNMHFIVFRKGKLCIVWSVISSGTYVVENPYMKRVSLGKQLVVTYVPTFIVANPNPPLLVLYWKYWK